MGKATGPTRSLVNGNTDVEYVVQPRKELVELSVCGFIGDIAHVKR